MKKKKVAVASVASVAAAAGVNVDVAVANTFRRAKQTFHHTERYKQQQQVT